MRYMLSILCATAAMLVAHLMPSPDFSDWRYYLCGIVFYVLIDAYAWLRRGA